MATTQEAVVQYSLEPLAVELREIPVPEIGDHDVLLQVGAVSVCGSDVHQFHATHSWAVNVPVVLGHEFCGTVAKAGRAVRGVKEGDRVVSETAAVICGTCLMCRTGRYNLCPTRKGFGYGVNGAMASYVATPARCLHAIPDSLPFEYACLCEPHAVAYQSMCVNSTIHPGDMVVVFGPGPIGLLCTRMAALAGANPLIVVGLTQDAPRLEAARALGATHTVDVSTGTLDDLVRSLDPLGADLVCEASGASRPLDAALKLVKPGGQVTKVGWSPDTIPIDINPLVGKAVTLQGSFSHNYPVWERVIHLLATGMAKPEIVVGLRSGLAGWRRAFDAMHDGEVIKSVLVPSAMSRGSRPCPPWRIASRSSPDRPPASARASPSTSPRSAPASLVHGLERRGRRAPRREHPLAVAATPPSPAATSPTKRCAAGSSHGGRSLRRPRHPGQQRRHLHPRLGRDARRVAFWDRMMAINLRAPFILMQEAIAPMRARGGGSDRQHRIDQRLRRHGHARPLLGLEGRADDADAQRRADALARTASASTSSMSAGR